MKKIALVTSKLSIDIDFDMSILVKACDAIGIKYYVCDWEDSSIDWSSFNLVIIRSPWNYVDKLDEFLSWCEKVNSQTNLLNSYDICKWNLNKIYLQDLINNNIKTVPFTIIKKGSINIIEYLNKFIHSNSFTNDFVIKPNIGAYSKNVRRFSSKNINYIKSYIDELHKMELHAIVQPYLESIDIFGESNLTFFNGSYSHAIKKSPMLQADGTVSFPSQDLRKKWEASSDEILLANKALEFASNKFNNNKPLTYARVDIVIDQFGCPAILELKLCEPSLNLPFHHEGALLFAKTIKLQLDQNY